MLRGPRTLGVITGAGLALAPVVAWQALHSSGDSGPPAVRSRPLPAVVSPVGLEARAGVRVTRIAASGGGGLLDVRFQVIDPGRAAVLHDADKPPAIVDERTGLVLGRVLMDHNHVGALKAGVSYFMLFVNSESLVQRGDRVSVVLGGERVRHLLVR